MLITNLKGQAPDQSQHRRCLGKSPEQDIGGKELVQLQLGEEKSELSLALKTSTKITIASITR